MTQGGQQEFAAYVAARQHALLRSAYLICGDQHLAQDLLQEALTKLAMRWGKVSQGYPDAFVRRVMVNDHISGWRRTKREQLSAVPPEPSAHHDESSDDRVDLIRALQLLPPRQRAVVVLRHFDDLTEAAVADLLGISIGTVKSQNHQALRRLRTLIPALTDEAEPSTTPEGTRP